MKTDLAPEEKKAALLLVSGKSRKEVANILDKPFDTVNEQIRKGYEKTGSRNLADFTRAMIGRLAKIDTEQLLMDAMKGALIVAGLIFLGYCFSRPEFTEAIQTSLSKIFNK